MKKLIILAGLLFAYVYTAIAGQYRVFIKIHHRSNPEKNIEANRSPLRLSIELIHDSVKENN